MAGPPNIRGVGADFTADHVSCKESDPILKFLINDHSPQGNYGVRVLVQSDHLDFDLCTLSSLQSLADQRATASTEIHHCNLTRLVLLNLLIRWKSFRLKEPSMRLLVQESFIQGVLVDVILDFIVLKNLLGGRLKVVGQWL